MAGTALFAQTNFPATVCSTVALRVPIAGTGGLPTSEITYGVPSSISAPTLSDYTTPTALSSGKVSVTFQSDGTVVVANNNVVNKALFLYNNRAPQETSSAISVLGAAGRIKVWRYDINATKYAE